MLSVEPQVPRPDEAPPTRLGKYELIARIGSGGMAEVHLARMRGPMSFEKLVVVKTIHPELASQEEFLRMLFDEARLSALIRHPSVVDIYELGRAGDAYFIAMEYLDGQSLSTIIAAGSAGFAIDPCSTARIIADAAAGLHAANELRTPSGKLFELVHRDVSPANIVVLYDGGVKIVDFGIAKARGRLTNSIGHQLKGKLGYASPEQLANERVDRRSDVFSLGVVLWETLANRRLFPGDQPQSALDRVAGADIPPPSSYSPQVPPPLDDITLCALAGRPEDRFQTAAEMKLALEDVLRTIGTHREKETIAHYMTRTFARRREERAQVLSRRRANTQSEFALPDDEGHFDVESESPKSGTLVAVRARDASGALQTGATSGPRWRRWALAAIAVVGLGVGATVVWRPLDGTRTERQPVQRQSTARRAPESSPLPTVKPPKPATAAAAPPAKRVDEPPAEPTEVAAKKPTEPRTAKPAKPAKSAAEPAKSAAELDREGADLFVKGNLLEAKERFKDAIAADPRHASAYRGLGLTYQALGKRDRAIAAFEKYLSLNPNAPDAEAVRARLAKLKP